MSGTSDTTGNGRAATVGPSIDGGERELLDLAIDNDYTTSVVPLARRRSSGLMALLWITFQANVIGMYTAYLARQEGMSLGQLLIAALIAVGALFLFGYGSATLGAYTGQTHTLLTRSIFGRLGSGLVSLLLIVMGMGWYAFTAYFLAMILQGLFGFNNLVFWSALFGAVMIFNNLFGFTGVAAYARFIASPIILVWGLATIIRGFDRVSPHDWFSSPHTAASMTVLVLAGLLIGSGMWGNEPDIYRYAHPTPWSCAPPLLIGYVTGVMVFSVAGYLMAELSTASQFGAIMKYFVNFSLFGLTGLAIIVFVINLFAINDGNLYEAINALQNLLGWRRILSVLLLGAIGAVLAAKMSSLANNFFIVAGISAVCVPCATTIMVMDVFVVPRLFGLKRPIDRVTPWHNSAPINAIGVIALLAGLALGTYTGGLIPNTPGFGTTYLGFPALQAWGLSALVYLGGTWVVRDHPQREYLLGYPRRPAPELAAREPSGAGASVSV